jgi:ACS family hexuronate transporter-like MFS transporter
MSYVRWWTLALLFFATTINYLDRIVLSVLAPVIREDIHMPEKVYGYVTGAFSFAYMIGFLFAGKFIDHVGTRIGYAVAITWWTIAAACHALARSALSLGFWRACWGWANRATFPLPSSAWPNGSPRRTAPSPPVSSTRAPTSPP